VQIWDHFVTEWRQRKSSFAPHSLRTCPENLAAMERYVQLKCSESSSRRAEVSPFADSHRAKPLRRRACRNGERGSELVESALVLPFILLPLILGAMYIGLAFSTYETLTRAAQDTARTYALNNTTTGFSCTNPITTTAPASFNSILAAGGVNSSSVANFLVAGTLPLYSGASASSCDVQVSFTYPYNIALPFYNFALTFTINAHSWQVD
jgi:Flp pilus assembly protein TadG